MHLINNNFVFFTLPPPPQLLTRFASTHIEKRKKTVKREYIAPWGFRSDLLNIFIDCNLIIIIISVFNSRDTNFAISRSLVTPPICTTYYATYRYQALQYAWHLILIYKLRHSELEIKSFQISAKFAKFQSSRSTENTLWVLMSKLVLIKTHDFWAVVVP